MSHETRLLDLVVEWEDRRAAGQDVSPEDLCRDCPELVEPLKARLRALAGLEAALDLGGPPLGETVACAQDCEPPPGGAGPVAENAWPVIANYEILEELGRGGMGVVSRRGRSTLGRIVALKTILPTGDPRGRFPAAIPPGSEGHGAVAAPQHRSDSRDRPAGRASVSGHGVCRRRQPFGKLLDGKPLPPSRAAELWWCWPAPCTRPTSKASSTAI